MWVCKKYPDIDNDKYELEEINCPVSRCRNCPYGEFQVQEDDSENEYDNDVAYFYSSDNYEATEEDLEYIAWLEEYNEKERTAQKGGKGEKNEKKRNFNKNQGNCAL